MADLQQVVGAILRDLAKARFGSDLYSRSIARYYENDYLLRKFPVPRSDIEEVEIDLKFSISEVQGSGVNTEGREANIAVLLERGVEEMVATFIDLGREMTEAPANRALREQLEQRISKGFGSPTLRIEMRQKALRYFIESYTHLIGPDGDFNSDLALRDIRSPFFWALAEYRNEGVTNEQLDEPLNPLFDHVFAHRDFVEAIKALEEPIKQIWHHNYDARLEVEIEGGKLAQLSESAISSIRIKAIVRNMIWTEVKTGKYKSQNALTSD